MKLSTKAQNLDILKKLRLKKSKIPNFFRYSVEEWTSNNKEITRFLLKKLNKKIIIRSSYILEDSKKYSMAGEFEGYSNINNNKREIFRRFRDIEFVQQKQYDVFGFTRVSNFEIEIGKDRILLYLVLNS